MQTRRVDFTALLVSCESIPALLWLFTPKERELRWTVWTGALTFAAVPVIFHASDSVFLNQLFLSIFSQNTIYSSPSPICGSNICDFSYLWFTSVKKKK